MIDFSERVFRVGMNFSLQPFSIRLVTVQSQISERLKEAFPRTKSDTLLLVCRVEALLYIQCDIPYRKVPFYMYRPSGKARSGNKNHLYGIPAMGGGKGLIPVLQLKAV